MGGLREAAHDANVAMDSSTRADMRIGDAVEAIFDMACVVSREARIGAGRNDDVVPVEAGNDRHGELGAGRPTVKMRTDDSSFSLHLLDG